MAESAPSPRPLLEQAQEATALAREAFATGNPVVGIAAVTLAAQLVQLARLLGAGDAR